MLEYIFLGIVQGIFEWIPISSEGVVALISRFLITDFNPVDVALFLHLGTLFAVLIYFRKDWKDVLILRNSNLVQFLTVATIISLAVGYPLYKAVRSIAVGNSLLLVMGFGLLLTAFFYEKEKKFKINLSQLAIITGFLQGLAVIPGLSRSASTIFGLSLVKASPSEILKYSYMMSAPVVLVLGVYLFLENQALLLEGWPSLVLSFIVGFLSLHFLINAAQKINFFKFALIFALLCFLGAAIGFLF